MAYAQTQPGSSRHECWRGGWADCTACLGRMHLPGCTSRQDPRKDCCLKRHAKLIADGQTQGLADASVPMLGTHAPAPLSADEQRALAMLPSDNVNGEPRWLDNEGFDPGPVLRAMQSLVRKGRADRMRQAETVRGEGRRHWWLFRRGTGETLL